MKKRRIFQSQADCSSETFRTPAQRKSSKSFLTNTVRKALMGIFEKVFCFFNVLLFFKKGPLSELHFPIDSLTKKTKGFAFITYMIPENAVAALAQLDGHIFQARMT